MRLIDADWVLGHLKPYEQSDEEWSVTGGTALRLIHNAVDNAPTVDAVVVTRCKDCKHYLIADEFEGGKRYMCEVNHFSYLNSDGDMHFCSYGEPKEGTHADDHD